MVKYSCGKIYKLVFENSDDIYVGSTCGTLKDRVYNHKHSSHGKVKSYVEKYGHTFKIILVESHSCKNKDELNKREQYWIDKLKPQFNTISAYTTLKKRNTGRRNREVALEKKIEEQNKQTQYTNKQQFERKLKSLYKPTLCHCCGQSFISKQAIQHYQDPKHIECLNRNKKLKVKNYAEQRLDIAFQNAYHYNKFKPDKCLATISECGNWVLSTFEGVSQPLFKMRFYL